MFSYQILIKGTYQKLMDLFEFASITKTKRNRRKNGNRAAFIFEWDVEEGEGEMLGIIRDIPLLDHNKKPIRGSSLIMEERSCAGWDPFFDASDIKVSGMYRWEGEFYSHTYSTMDGTEYDWGFDDVSIEPADRKTRKALEAYKKGEQEIVCPRCFKTRRRRVTVCPTCLALS